MNGHLYFEIHADDPERAAAFYNGVFDWEVKKDPNNVTDYWRIETGGMAGGCSSARPARRLPNAG